MTKEPKWTKADWFVYSDVGSDTISVYHTLETLSDNEIVHWCGFDDVPQKWEEKLANAHLIAAAPELYEALTLMIVHFTPSEQMPLTQKGYAVKKAKAALSKALGERE